MAAVTVVTTFSPKLWEQFGKRCIQSWAAHFPESIRVILYVENPIDWRIPDHWSMVALSHYPPYAEFMGKNREQGFRDYRKDARRFAHKVFALAHAAGMTTELGDTDFLIWLDADVFCFEDVPADFFPSLFQEHYLFYLGRSKYTHSECGCYGYNTRHSSHHPFFQESFAGMYASGKVFELPEQHDSWVFDYLRKRFEQQGMFTSHNISPQVGKGHAWLASPLAQYFDHLKGDRWKSGKSWKEDESGLTQQGVQLQLIHPYWRHLPSRVEAR